ncbi:MAG: metal-sensing transcriptional repressor [Methanobacteriaceae archaeon]|nr:metal-sensing transcriptional repressor [Methanobacteriaceae archaeon]
MVNCLDDNDLHKRLKKIEGQIAAIDRMIQNDNESCEKVLMQVNASKSALNKVGKLMVEKHINHCIKNAIEKGDSEEAIEDFSNVLEYYSRI